MRQSQIVQSVMQDCKYVLSHLLPVCRFCGVDGNLLVQIVDTLILRPFQLE